MEPGTVIRMLGHRNEETISWVPDGVIRHDGQQGNELITDPDHLLVMNAGSGFWHAEETAADDPPLRMLQIFVRPHSLELEPGIQHERIPDAVRNEWRHLFGPEGGEAPLSSATTSTATTAVSTPGRPLRSHLGRVGTYLYVFEGEVTVDGVPVEYTESSLVTGETDASVAAVEESTVIAFRLDPDAPVTRSGTIGR
ncbi:pirin family protein [Natronococcus sp. A-GB1]|nr:pirin family protein [Natronococcus sp. A-GB1]MDG5761192.1 pirin family protein [Natronococcus sp. A-GB1]